VAAEIWAVAGAVVLVTHVAAEDTHNLLVSHPPNTKRRCHFLVSMVINQGFGRTNAWITSAYSMFTSMWLVSGTLHMDGNAALRLKTYRVTKSRHGQH
jgi:hypothetical protein